MENELDFIDHEISMVLGYAVNLSGTYRGYYYHNYYRSFEQMLEIGQILASEADMVMGVRSREFKLGRGDIIYGPEGALDFCIQFDYLCGCNDGYFYSEAFAIINMIRQGAIAALNLTTFPIEFRRN